jgi:hypothetical protein
VATIEPGVGYDDTAQRSKRHAWLALHELAQSAAAKGEGDPLSNYLGGLLVAATLRPDYLALVQSIL